MFERFTDRARKVMALANQEAQRLNQEYIATEHILVGLLRERNSAGVQVLKTLGIDPDALQAAIAKLAKSGPEMVSMGRLPQSVGAKRVIENAIAEARRLGHSYIGTEHLLLGLLSEGEGLAVQTLREFNVSLESARAAVAELLQDGFPVGGRQARPRPPVTPSADRVLQMAAEESAGMHHNYIGTEHMLLAIMREPTGVAAQVMKNLGVDAGHVRQEVRFVLGLD